VIFLAKILAEITDSFESLLLLYGIQQYGFLQKTSTQNIHHFGEDPIAFTTALKVPMAEINVANCWSKEEYAGGSKPSMEINQYYAAIHITGAM
jgi:hypothetical protein